MEQSNIYSLLTNLVLVVGSIITTYGAIAWRRRADKRKAPKDRIETIFDGYDALLAQLREDNTRKGEIIDSLKILVDKQSETLQAQATEIRRSQDLIGELRIQLKKSDEQTQRLQAQLENLRGMAVSEA